MVDQQVISPGVDQSVFHPGDREQSRREVGISPEETVLLYLANNLRDNHSKDFTTIEQALSLIAIGTAKKVTLLVIGMEGESRCEGRVTVRSVAYQSDPAIVATYYQSADIFLHAAHAENFPYTIIAALCCRVPVIATAVGGIPELITDGFNGLLVAPRDSTGMAARGIELLKDHHLRQLISQRARTEARWKYDLNRQTNEYLKL
ncbi:MAG: glycosyltransferase [Acidobacteria bacterium]|nr:glycosyltransferase [Acidobacteriota bacterium]